MCFAPLQKSKRTAIGNTTNNIVILILTESRLEYIEPYLGNTRVNNFIF